MQEVDPAYAGMILALSSLQAQVMSGPRVCGDDPGIYPKFFVWEKWTPRMRG